MTGAILLLICLILIGLSLRSFQNGLRRAQTERVLGRLAEGQPQLTEEAGQWSGVEKKCSCVRASANPATAWGCG